MSAKTQELEIQNLNKFACEANGCEIGLERCKKLWRFVGKKRFESCQNLFYYQLIIRSKGETGEEEIAI